MFSIYILVLKLISFENVKIDLVINQIKCWHCRFQTRAFVVVVVW